MINLRASPEAYAYFIVLTLAELHFSPTSLSLVSRLAPPRASTSFLGNLAGASRGLPCSAR